MFVKRQFQIRRLDDNSKFLFYNDKQLWFIEISTDDISDQTTSHAKQINFEIETGSFKVIKDVQVVHTEESAKPTAIERNTFIDALAASGPSGCKLMIYLQGTQRDEVEFVKNEVFLMNLAI